MRRGKLVVPLMLALAALATGVGYVLRQWVSAVPRRLSGILGRLEASGDFVAYGRELEEVFALEPTFKVFADILPWPGQPEAASLPKVESQRAADRFQDHKMALLKLCRQGRYSTAQCDLLLALLLQREGHLTPAARLLELVRAEGRGSRAADALLSRVYARLGRGPDARESPVRDPLAVW